MRPFNVCLKHAIHYLQSVPLKPKFEMTNSEFQVWGGYRTMYASAAIWLENLLLGEKLSSKAYKDGINAMPLAEKLAADFKLIIALHSRASSPVILFFPSPATLWLIWCIEMGQRDLESAGLTGHPRMIGKRQQYQETIRVVDALEAQNYTLPFERTPANIYELVLYEALQLAETDHCFYLNYFLPHLRTTKKYVNRLKNCKHLQKAYIDKNDDLIASGKSVKLSHRL